MTFSKKLLFLFFFIFSSMLLAQGILIQRVSKQAHPEPDFFHPAVQEQTTKAVSDSIKIAFLSAPSLIGGYNQSTYGAALATLLSKPGLKFTLDQFPISNESPESLKAALDSIHDGQYDCIIAPLTLSGAQKLSELSPSLPVYIPTIHKNEVSSAPTNILFGGIDYEAQIESLKPFMASSLAIFYGDSSVGIRLKNITESLAAKNKSQSFSVNKDGSNIISHLSKPALFSKRSIILHTPVVKSSMIASHTTFMQIREHNLLSTQVNMDPAILTLTQYNDRKNMIIANSIIEQSPMIYHYASLYNIDISFDWVNYSTTIGADYLLSSVMNTPREYTLPITASQVQYPIQLVRPKEFGFEPISSK